MKSRKFKKFVTVLTLVISLITVQTLEITAMASTGTPDLSNPDVVVSDMESFFNAVSTAEDGTVIGIDTVIYINAGSYQIGSEADPKHLYLVRKSGNAGIYITNTANLTIYNMTIDGNRSSVSGDCPMFTVNGALNLHYSTVQNADMFGEKGTIYVADSASFFSVGTTYTNNAASVGGHIVSAGDTRLNGCVLTNGSGREYGGAIHVSSGTTTIENCKIIGNQAGNWGGGINNAGGSVTVSQSVIYNNTANYGSDIANDVNSQFQIDSLEDTMSLYEAEGISPVAWVFDGLDEGESNSAVTDRFNVSDPYALMKLSCEDESAGGDDSDDTEDGGTSDDNTGADDGTGDTGDSGNTEDGGTTGDGDNTGDTEDSGNTDDSGTSDDTGNTEDGGNQDDTGNTEDGGDQGDTGSTEDGGNQDDSGNTEDSGSSDDTGSEDSGNQEDSGSTTDPDDTGNGDSTGDNSGTTDGSQDNTDTGNGDSSTDESGDNTDTGNQDDTTGDTGNDDTQNGGSSDDTSDSASDGNVTNNYYDQSSTTTEDNSSVTNNTDTYEDKSSSTTNTTTTNNYYTYNTPQGANAPDKTSGTKVSNNGKAATVTEKKSETVSGNSTSESANMQLPDNLTLDLHGVDVSYEIVDGVPKIIISNDKITEQAVAEPTEATTRTMEQQPLTDNAINTASVTADSENTSASINWYEIIKMGLLAAILIVVLYKPSAKKGTITAVD